MAKLNKYLNVAIYDIPVEWQDWEIPAEQIIPVMTTEDMAKALHTGRGREIQFLDRPSNFDNFCEVFTEAAEIEELAIIDKPSKYDIWDVLAINDEFGLVGDLWEMRNKFAKYMKEYDKKEDNVNQLA